MLPNIHLGRHERHSLGVRQRAGNAAAELPHEAAGGVGRQSSSFAHHRIQTVTTNNQQHSPEVGVFEDVLVLQELHVVVPDPLHAAHTTNTQTSDFLLRKSQTNAEGVRAHVPPAGQATRQS